jgi:hypothetical protein
VTLSDEEARRRGTQKTVLERRSPPTFDVLIELQERDLLVVHSDVAAAVDAMVRGIALEPEIRSRDEKGEIKIQKPAQTSVTKIANVGKGLNRSFSNGLDKRSRLETENDHEADRGEIPSHFSSVPEPDAQVPLSNISIYPYGVARNRMMQAAKHLGVPATILHTLDGANVMITLKSYYRRRQKAIMDAEEHSIPIYVLRSNSILQIEQVLVEIFNLHSFGEQAIRSLNSETINNQTQAAIEAVRNGQRWVDLPPAMPAIRRMQHELVRQSDLISHSYGKEPSRHVRIFRE